MLRLPLSLTLGLLALISTGVQADDHSHNAAAHQHGVGHLNLVLEGQQLILELSTPAEDLLGFEHAPRTPEQQAQLNTLKEILGQPEKLFTLPAAAQCDPEPVTLHSSLFAESVGSGSDDQAADQHADISAHYAFHCARVENLQHLEVILFEQFPGSTKLLLQAITPSGQYGGELSASDHRIRF